MQYIKTICDVCERTIFQDEEKQTEPGVIIRQDGESKQLIQQDEKD